MIKTRIALITTCLFAAVCTASGADLMRPTKVEISGVENAYRVGSKFLSGGEPAGAKSFEALRALGVRTIISVDGSKPDVESARKVGIRYIHLPVGYDAIPQDQALRLVQAARTFDGPIFIHCHHGKHRGPAALAICGMAGDGWSKTQAIDWMKTAGTSLDYRGLYASAERFRMPSAQELAKVGTAFPESAETPGLVDAMVAIDRHWDTLKAARTAGYPSTLGRPDHDPSQTAILLLERFREARRLEDSKAQGDEFLKIMTTSENQALELAEGFKTPTNPERRARLDATMTALGKSCAACHVRFRDR